MNGHQKLKLIGLYFYVSGYARANNDEHEDERDRNGRNEYECECL